MNETTVLEFHLSQQFLIIVTDYTKNCSHNLSEIFKIMWTNSLINAHVLCQNDNQIWSLYTFIPYQEDCFELSRREIASFTPFNYTRNITLTATELFPQKLDDFNNCSLFIAPSVVNPQIVFRNTSNKIKRYQGIDIEIIKLISKSLNFDIKYKTSSYGTGHGYVYRNGTATGNLGLVSRFFPLKKFFPLKPFKQYSNEILERNIRPLFVLSFRF